jgi:hypothetical protein
MKIAVGIATEIGIGRSRKKFDSDPDTDRGG